MSADIVNMMMYLQHGQPFPKRLKVSGTVSASSMIGYKKYTGRENAKENSVEDKIDFDGGYFSYTSRETAKDNQEQKRTISHLGWLDNEDKEKAFRQEVADHFNKDGDLAWVPVTSFKDFLTAEQYGLFKDEDYAAVVTKVLPQFFKRVGFKEDNMIWWMDFHTNTDNPHAHFAFLEKEKIRTNPKFAMKDLNYFKGLIYKESLARQRIINNTADVGIDFLKNKDILFKEVRNKSKENLQSKSDRYIDWNIKELYKKLPDENDLPSKKRLQYNSIHMKEYRKEIDKIVDMILESPKIKDSYNDLIETCDLIDQKKSTALTTVYHSVRDSEVEKLYSYLGNQILQGKKEYRAESISTIRFKGINNVDELDDSSDYFEGDSNTEMGTKNRQIVDTNKVTENQNKQKQFEVPSTHLIGSALNQIAKSRQRIEQETESNIDEFYERKEFI